MSTETPTGPIGPTGLAGDTAAASRNPTDPRSRARAMLLLLAFGSLTWQFGFGVYRSIYNNFLVEVHGIKADQLGAIESLREVPGLLVVVLVALVAGLAPSVVSGLSCLFMAVGLVLYPMAGGLTQLIIITVLFSVGFHMLFPSQNTLILYHAGEGERGKWLGVMDSVGAAAALLAMGAATVLINRVGFGGMFFLAAGGAALGAAVLFSTPGPRRLSTAGRSLNIKRQYVTYYVMTLLQGARRHFFLVFALYNLVEVHKVPAPTIAVLLGISGAASIITRPILGRLADRFGEIKVLTWCYGLVALVFLGYAFVGNLTALYVLFTLDSILTFELVITLYAYSVARGSEVASALASGSTIGHITGVLVPFSGGLLWKFAGPAATFLAGAAICLTGLGYSVWLGRRRARQGIWAVAGAVTASAAGSGPDSAS